MTMQAIDLVNRCNTRMLALYHAAQAKTEWRTKDEIQAQIDQIRLLRDELRFAGSNS